MKDLNALFGSLGELVGIALNSLYVFLLPTAIAAALGTPVAIYLYRRDGKTAEAVEAIINGLVVMPTTLPSLLLYFPLARTGALALLTACTPSTPWCWGTASSSYPYTRCFAFAALIDPRVVELLSMFPSARFSGLSF